MDVYARYAKVLTKSIEKFFFRLHFYISKKRLRFIIKILSRVKDVSNKKKRRKNARKNAIKNIGEIKKKNKRLQKAKSPNFKKRLGFERLKEFLKAKKQIQTALNRGNLTQEQFDRFNAELDKLIDQIKKQGGIV